MIAVVPRAGIGSALIGVLAIALAQTQTAPAQLQTAAVTVERIVIRGNTRTRDKVIWRELGITEGEPVGAVELDRARRRLRALGYFLVVAVSAGPGSAPELARIAVDVVEPPRPRTGGFISAENFIAECVIRQN